MVSALSLSAADRRRAAILPTISTVRRGRALVWKFTISLCPEGWRPTARSFAARADLEPTIADLEPTLVLNEPDRRT
jgi:hypothetical protein